MSSGHISAVSPLLASEHPDCSKYSMYIISLNLHILIRRILLFPLAQKEKMRLREVN